ncbi:MAG TPA: hypothetical protein VNE62_09655 [Actinomycetota bacterium]|nr:hypothetical protein [Actinomycetota bacterium]
MQALGLVLLLILGVAGCGKPASVGSEVPLDVKGGENRRLGETPTPDPRSTPAPNALGVATPTPAPKAVQVTAAPTVAPKKEYFELALVTDSPYYAPNPEVEFARGTVLRVTNKDTIPERKFRTYTASGSGGNFSSGPLKPGQVWEFTPGPGQYNVTDEGLTFARGALTVR